MMSLMVSLELVKIAAGTRSTVVPTWSVPPFLASPDDELCSLTADEQPARTSPATRTATRTATSVPSGDRRRGRGDSCMGWGLFWGGGAGGGGRGQDGGGWGVGGGVRRG